MESPTHFAKLLMPSTPPFSDYSCDGSSQLGPLSLVNIFIGANNSGKSRLLRALFSLKEYQYTTNKYGAQIILEVVKEAKREFDEVWPRGANRVGNIGSKHFEEIGSLEAEFITPSHPIYDLVEKKLRELKNAAGDGAEYTGTIAPNNKELHPLLQAIGNKALERFSEIEIDKNVAGAKKYYIPILRGMRPLDNSQNNLYRARTLEDYFDKEGGLPSETVIFTGIELYQTLKIKLLGEPEDREAVRKFEDFLSTKFFNSRPITLIPREGDSRVHIKIGNDAQFPIHNLGDGLQTLIICSFNIFMEKTACLFFIEEPDMCMHPSLQRSFLDALVQFNQHQYFITTQSNHLLDLTFDFSNISIFHFTKVEGAQPQIQVHIASTGDQNVLRDLGVRNSSVFLSNATIWVEGITDRLYLRTFMRKYCKELETANPKLAQTLNRFKEDSHYSFVEYQGSNLVHWSFDPEDEEAKRIKATYVCARAFLIADGDIASKGEREATYKSVLGDRFYILPGKEIENFIPLEVLERVIADKFKGYSKGTGLIKYEDYSKQGTGLGRYLDNLLGLPIEEAEFADDSGTVKSKGRFCEKAIEIMNDPQFEWTLPDELKELCRIIFHHILRENRDQGKDIETPG